MDPISVIPITFDVFAAGVSVGTVHVAEPIVVLGRDGAAHVWVDDDALSASHLMIEANATDVSLASLGAATFVNGLPVERCLLCSGDELRIGHTTIRVSLGEPVEFVPKKPSLVEREHEVEAVAPTHYRTTTHVARHTVSNELNLLEARETSEASDLDASTSSVVELSIAWNDTLLHVAHIERDETFVLTSEASNHAHHRFVVGSEVLPALSECAVVVRRGRAQRFVFPPGATGSLELDGVTKPLETLLSEGLARPSIAAPGAHEIEIGHDGRYTLRSGGLTIRAKRVARARSPRVAPTRDRPWNLALFTAFVLVFGSLLASRVAAASGRDERSQELVLERLDYVRGLIERQQLRMAEQAAAERTPEDELNEAIRAQRARRYGPESGSGRHRRELRSDEPERRSNASVVWSSGFEERVTHRPAILGRLGPYGSTGADPVLFCTRGAREPLVRPRPPTVTGLLDANSVRRVVLRNLAQLRVCYSAGLRAQPRLAGRVVLRFILGGTGMVMGSTVDHSTLEDPVVADCMARATRRWQFPAPENGGIVTVKYPFDLEPNTDTGRR